MQHTSLLQWNILGHITNSSMRNVSLTYNGIAWAKINRLSFQVNFLDKTGIIVAKNIQTFQNVYGQYKCSSYSQNDLVGLDVVG